MNTLYQCKTCYRYSRQYFIDLKDGYDPVYKEKRSALVLESFTAGESLCPHCEETFVERSSNNEKWIDSHPDAPLLTHKNIKDFEEAKEEASIMIYEKMVNLKDKDRDIDYLYNDMLAKLTESKR